MCWFGIGFLTRHKNERNTISNFGRRVGPIRVCLMLLDVNTTCRGCLEVHTPCLVKEKAVFGMGQLS